MMSSASETGVLSPLLLTNITILRATTKAATTAATAAAMSLATTTPAATASWTETSSTASSAVFITTSSTAATTTATTTIASSAEAIVVATLATITATPAPTSTEAAVAEAAATVATAAAATVVRAEWLWIAMGGCCALGLVLNLIVVGALLRTKCNGTLNFLLQLAICDTISLFVGALELIYINQQRWTFPPETCPLYLGLESISSTATVYLLVALNLHAVSTYNLARRTIAREEKLMHDQRQYQLAMCTEDDDDDEDEDIGGANTTDDVSDENHYAPILAEPSPIVEASVDGYETPIQTSEFCELRPEHTYQKPYHRSLTIDYSQRKRSVSVILPVLFVWFIAASASTPLFAFGSVLPNWRTPLVCGVVNFDPANNQLLRTMVLAMRVALPTVSILLTGCSVAWTMRSVAKRIRPCGLDENVADILRIALALSVTYVLASQQRVWASLMPEMWSQRPLMLPKYPRLPAEVALLLSALHWMGSIVRPLVYWAMDGTVRAEVRRTLCLDGTGIGKKTAAEGAEIGGRSQVVRLL